MSHLLKAVLFDVDGTLVDSNDAHAHAWVKAFADSGITVEFAHVRRCIGMGGDKLMPEVGGLEEDSPLGSTIAKRRGEIFATEFLPKIQPFKDAGRLVAAVKDLGLTAVAASSAKKDELKALLEIAGADALMDAATSSDDAEESKPDSRHHSGRIEAGQGVTAGSDHDRRHAVRRRGRAPRRRRDHRVSKRQME